MANPANPWISVKDRLPKFRERVDVWLALAPDGPGLRHTNVWREEWGADGRYMWISLDYSEIEDGEWEADRRIVTHWMPIPEPPEEPSQ